MSVERTLERPGPTAVALPLAGVAGFDSAISVPGLSDWLSYAASGCVIC